MIKNKTAYLGLLTGVALMLSYIETLIPFQVGIPGVKLGLANLAVVLCLYLFSWKEAVCLAVVKACLTGFLFGNLFMILYSLAGALLSVLVMALLRAGNRFHVPVVSGAGGVAHNLGQLLVAFAVTRTDGLIFYLPVLLIAGLLTGLLIGAVSVLVLPAIQKII